MLLRSADAHLLIAIQRRQVAVVDALYDVWAGPSSGHMAGHELHHECEGERAMDKEIAMPFDRAGVLAIKMDGVGVEGEGREAEEKRGSGRKRMGELGAARGCSLVSRCHGRAAIYSRSKYLTGAM